MEEKKQDHFINLHPTQSFYMARGFERITEISALEKQLQEANKKKELDLYTRLVSEYEALAVETNMAYNNPGFANEWTVYGKEYNYKAQVYKAKAMVAYIEVNGLEWKNPVQASEYYWGAADILINGYRDSGDAEQQRKDLMTCMSYVERALELDPSNDRALAYKGMFLNDMGEKERAIAVLSQLPENSYFRYKFHQVRLVHYWSDEQYDAFLDYVEEHGLLKLNETVFLTYLLTRLYGISALNNVELSRHAWEMLQANRVFERFIEHLQEEDSWEHLNLKKITHSRSEVYVFSSTSPLNHRKYLNSLENIFILKKNAKEPFRITNECRIISFFQEDQFDIGVFNGYIMKVHVPGILGVISKVDNGRTVEFALLEKITGANDLWDALASDEIKDRKMAIGIIFGEILAALAIIHARLPDSLIPEKMELQHYKDKMTASFHFLNEELDLPQQQQSAFRKIYDLIFSRTFNQILDDYATTIAKRLHALDQEVYKDAYLKNWTYCPKRNSIVSLDFENCLVAPPHIDLAFLLDFNALDLDETEIQSLLDLYLHFRSRTLEQKSALPVRALSKKGIDNFFNDFCYASVYRLTLCYLNLVKIVLQYETGSFGVMPHIYSFALENKARCLERLKTRLRQVSGMEGKTDTWHTLAVFFDEADRALETELQFRRSFAITEGDFQAYPPKADR